MLTHCHQIYIRKEISRPRFPDVSRYSVVHPIDLRRVFLRYLGTQIFRNVFVATMCHAQGSVWWVVWAESPIQI